MGHKKVERIDPLTLALPVCGADSHAHLDDEAFDADRSDVLARAEAVGLSTIVNIFLNPLEFPAKKGLFAAHSNVAWVLGIHPCDGLRFGEDALEALEKALREEPIVALGEIGLDYHWPDCPREVQLALFARELELARSLHKPVVIHCREAEADCLTVLESHGFAGYPLLWHCFGGDQSLARRLLHNGWMISVPGPVTYPANSAMRSAIATIPDDRLLIETDCPYLAPHPWRGKRNEPAFTVFTAHAIAEIRQQQVEQLWKMTGDNCRRFFGLKRDPLSSV